MAAGKFVRHKVTGFETYIPAEHWDESYSEEYEVRDPEEQLRKAHREMVEASKRHDEALAAKDKKPAPTITVSPLKPSKPE